MKSVHTQTIPLCTDQLPLVNELHANNTSSFYITTCISRFVPSSMLHPALCIERWGSSLQQQLSLMKVHSVVNVSAMIKRQQLTQLHLFTSSAVQVNGLVARVLFVELERFGYAPDVLDLSLVLFLYHTNLLRHPYSHPSIANLRL